MENIIYGLYCPLNKNIVYVGKSSVGLDRPYQHIKEKSHSEKVNNWVRQLKLSGLSPTIIVLDKDIENTEILTAKEHFWINYYISKGALLLNSQIVTPETLAVYEENNQEIINQQVIGLSNYVRGRRRGLKLTQPQLAQLSGMGLRFIREIEQGNKQNFSTKSINRLLWFLGKAKLGLVFPDQP